MLVFCSAAEQLLCKSPEQRRTSNYPPVLPEYLPLNSPIKGTGRILEKSRTEGSTPRAVDPLSLTYWWWHGGMNDYHVGGIYLYIYIYIRGSFPVLPIHSICLQAKFAMSLSVCLSMWFCIIGTISLRLYNPYRISTTPFIPVIPALSSFHCMLHFSPFDLPKP